jgi:L-ascorbate metabolism protein UlaG (beta-lactamase superfamily)
MPHTDTDQSTITVTTIGGPTHRIEIGGLRLLVDPTFDEPGSYEMGNGRQLTKTAPPAVGRGGIGPVDAVLLSHDQHVDNLDRSGRDLLAEVAEVLTTPLAASRLGPDVRAVGLAPWSEHSLAGPGGGAVRVTAVPAQHGPDGTEHLTGPVTGFVLEAEGYPTTYVSGDNASVDLVREIADRFPDIELAVVFAGAARTALLGDALLTLDAGGVAEAARILDGARIVLVHCDSWAHFSEDRAAAAGALDRAGFADRLVPASHGEPFVAVSAR